MVGGGFPNEMDNLDIADNEVNIKVVKIMTPTSKWGDQPQCFSNEPDGQNFQLPCAKIPFRFFQTLLDAITSLREVIEQTCFEAL